MKTAQTIKIDIAEAVINFVEQFYQRFFGYYEKLLCEGVGVYNRAYQVVCQRDF